MSKRTYVFLVDCGFHEMQALSTSIVWTVVPVWQDQQSLVRWTVNRNHVQVLALESRDTGKGFN